MSLFRDRNYHWREDSEILGATREEVREWARINAQMSEWSYHTSGSLAALLIAKAYRHVERIQTREVA